jgi:non-ribosomal peptide synthetase component F
VVPLSLHAVVGWFALVPPSVAAMAVVMWARNDPHASVPTALMLSVVSVAFGTFAWHTVHPLLPGRVGADHQEDADR